MKMLQRFVLLAALVALLGSVAMADSIEYSSYTVAPAAAPYTVTFPLDNFNPSLGSLQSITLSLAYTMSGEIDVVNYAFPPNTLSFMGATSSIPLTLTGPGSLDVTTTAGLSIGGGTVLPYLFTFPSVYSVSGLSSVGTVYSYPSNFSLFETPPGATTDNFTVSVGTGSFSGTGPSGLAYGGDATVGATIEVAYDYIPKPKPVPESSSLLLMSPALLGGLGLLRKRLAR